MADDAFARHFDQAFNHAVFESHFGLEASATLLFVLAQLFEDRIDLFARERGLPFLFELPAPVAASDAPARFDDPHFADHEFLVPDGRSDPLDLANDALRELLRAGLPAAPAVHTFDKIRSGPFAKDESAASGGHHTPSHGGQEPSPRRDIANIAQRGDGNIGT